VLFIGLGREELWDKSTAWMKEEEQSLLGGLWGSLRLRWGRVEPGAWREDLLQGKGAGMMPHLQQHLHDKTHMHIVRS
jgi:hypothetical protein